MDYGGRLIFHLGSAAPYLTLSVKGAAVVERSNIKNLTIEELSGRLAALDQPRHRTGQILKWLYQKGASSFAEMTNLPLALRGRLDEMFTISSLSTVETVNSNSDPSRKFLLASDDGSIIEAVLMDIHGHRTICISSQIGCPLGCTFCRTGESGYERNLRSDEILNQVLFFRKYHIPARSRFNIVFMGMGEPLLNPENLNTSLEILNSLDAFALGRKRITVSTIGIPAAIRRLTAGSFKFGLAVSLNATTDELRKRLMPGAYGIGETLDSAEDFARSRRMRATLEYVLLAGVNDAPEDARRLASLTHGRPFKINVIPFNEWESAPFSRPSEHRIDRFVGLLLPDAPAVTVRRSQGGDIAAACGQLRIRHLSREN